MIFILNAAMLLARRAGLVRTARALLFVQILMPAFRALYAAGFLPRLPNLRQWLYAPSVVTSQRLPTPARETRLEWLPAPGLSFFALPLGIRAEQNYRGMGELGPATLRLRAGQAPDEGRAANVSKPEGDHEGSPLPALTVVVPARNEARNLRRLLPTLMALDYPGQVEILVVDDGSSDGTGAVAAELGARVIRLDTLPAGWYGKPYACHRGALAAQGDWILFSDADTMHQPDSAARAVMFARDHGLDGITLFLKQEFTRALDGAVLITAFAGLFAGTTDTRALMNGQYILLKRKVYLESGGFEPVRNEPLEDLALGSLLRRKGYMVLALRGENAAAVRMYASPAQMWNGMTRLGAGSLKYSGGGAILTALYTTALVSPLMVLVGVLRGGIQFIWLPLTWLAASASVLPLAHRFGAAWMALLAPFGALFVLLAAWWGLLRRLLGRGIVWKERGV